MYIGRRIRAYKVSSRLGKYWLISAEPMPPLGEFRGFGKEVSRVTKAERYPRTLRACLAKMGLFRSATVSTVKREFFPF